MQQNVCWRKGNKADIRKYKRGSSRNKRKRAKSIEVKLENYQAEVEEERNADLDEMGIADNVDDDMLEEVRLGSFLAFTEISFSNIFA